MNWGQLAAGVALMVGGGYGICWLIKRLERAGNQPLEQVRPIGDPQQDAAYLTIVYHLEREHAEMKRLFDDGRDW